MNTAASNSTPSHLCSLKAWLLTSIATDQKDAHDASLGSDPAKQALVTIDASPPTSSVKPLTPKENTDFTVKWRPERNHRGFPYFLWQSEAMGRTYRADNFDDGTTVLAGATLEDWGFYTQGIYGFMPGWRGGLRFDYATGSGDSIGGSGNDPFRDDRYRLSPLLEWLPSEFSRVRFQVNYDHADHLADKDAISFWIGFEYLIGAHAAHKY